MSPVAAKALVPARYQAGVDALTKDTWTPPQFFMPPGDTRLYVRSHAFLI